MASRCPLCSSAEAEDELNHLLIHFPAVWGLWRSLISLQVSACLGSVKGLIWRWCGFPMRKKARKLWLAMPPCLFWNMEGEELDCKDAIFSISSLKSSFLAP